VPGPAPSENDMIRKTFKMALLTGAVLGGAGFLILGTAFPSYVSTMASSVRESVVGQIPIELEIKRAEGLISQIDPQIQTCKRDLARAEVELEELQGSIGDLEQTVGLEEQKLKRGVKLLDGDGNGSVALAADFGARRRVNLDLQRTKDSYVNNMAILKTKRALVERQARAVEAAKQKLIAVRSERENLSDQIRSLKTQQREIEAMTANSSRFDLDSTALSQAKEVITTVRKRLDVTQRMLENEMLWNGEDPNAVAMERRDMVQEIHELFAEPAGSGGQVIDLHSEVHGAVHRSR
ncbi:MAG: hypothetical protein KDE27_26540, partial [Planctomycetes bacterium]|nr:hypothetical protein [Planctomycetota bacterium]